MIIAVGPVAARGRVAAAHDVTFVLRTVSRRQSTSFAAVVDSVVESRARLEFRAVDFLAPVPGTVAVGAPAKVLAPGDFALGEALGETMTANGTVLNAVGVPAQVWMACDSEELVMMITVTSQHIYEFNVRKRQKRRTWCSGIMDCVAGTRSFR